jgi:hypothetical protein
LKKLVRIGRPLRKSGGQLPFSYGVLTDYDKITSRVKSSVVELEVTPADRTIIVDVPYAVYLGRKTGSKDV